MEPQYKMSLTVGLRSERHENNGRDYSPQWFEDRLFDTMAASGIEGYSVTNHIGVWRGEEEPSATVCVLVPGNSVQRTTEVLRDAAKRYNAIALQDASILTGERVQVEFV